MVAGLNVFSRIWRMVNIDDDDVGGAVVTGILLHDDVMCRIQASMPEQLLLQQGLETDRLFTITMYPASLSIRENDEVEVISPYNHKYYGQRFLVVGVIESNFHPSDRRGYLLVNVRRVEHRDIDGVYPHVI